MNATAAWLIKSEPHTFSIDDLLALPEKSTLWDGVRNFQARNNLRLMRKGERCFFYHSSCAVPAIVGEAKVAAEAIADETAFDPTAAHYDVKSKRDNPTWFAPKIKGRRKYAHWVSREQMSRTRVKNSLLFRNSRLSVIPLTAAEVKIIDTLIAAGSKHE